MMPSFALCVVTFAWLQVIATLAQPPFESQQPKPENILPKCQYETEVQFYTAEIDILELPEACHVEKHLTTMGFLIQDSVHSCEDQLPVFLEEKSETKVCPFPKEIQQEETLLRRSLGRNGNASQNPNPNSSPNGKKRRSYKYGMVGNCRRCRGGRGKPKVKRELSKDNVCSISEQVERLRDETKYAATTSQAVLASMEETAAGGVHPRGDVQVTEILSNANSYARECLEASEIAGKSTKTARQVCESLAELESSTSSLEKLADIELEFAAMAVASSKASLAGIRKAERDLDVLLHLQNAVSRRLRGLSGFGIEKLIFVDADANEDVPEVLSCDPINPCVGSVTRFNIRAETYGSVRRVNFASNGPLGDTNRVENAAPFSLFSDIRGNYFGRHLTPGTYTVSAWAEDLSGDTSTVVSKTFTIAQATSTGAPTSAPTFLPTTSPTQSPTNDPTEAPTSLPTGSPTAVPLSTGSDMVGSSLATAGARVSDASQFPNAAASESIAASEAEYVERLSSNLETSNTACEQVKEAMIQKTIAEETAIQGDEVYDDLMKLSLGHEGNADVERIKSEAELAHLQVRVEVTKAIAAADLASQTCAESSQLTRSLRKLSGDDELQVAETGVVDARMALAQLKAWRDELEEVIALAEFDPAMSVLDGDNDRDENILAEHKENVETEIMVVESELQTVPSNSSEAIALENKKESLVVEEAEIQEALENEQEFTIGQSALKKDEMYDSLAPDFVESPPLKYILRFTQNGNDTTVEKNWNPEDETPGTKAVWFRQLGDMVVVDVPRRLKLIYNTEMGGCITEDTELSVVVVVTEAESVWEAPKEECEVESVVPQGEVTDALTAEDATSSTLTAGEGERPSVPLSKQGRGGTPPKWSKGDSDTASTDVPADEIDAAAVESEEATTTPAASIEATTTAVAEPDVETTAAATLQAAEPDETGNEDCIVEIKGKSAWWAGINAGFDSPSATLDFSGSGLDLSTVTVGKGVFDSAVVSGQTITLTKPRWVSKTNTGFFEFNANGIDALLTMSPPACVSGHYAD